MTWGFLIGFLIFVLVIVGIIRTRDLKHKLQKQGSSRPVMSKQAYLNYFEEKGYDRQHVDLVYEEIKTFVDFEGFSMYPNDNLIFDYEIEIDDFYKSIFKKLDLQKPENEVFEELEYDYNEQTAEFILKVLKAAKNE
jgi:hypothetical protein